VGTFINLRALQKEYLVTIVQSNYCARENFKKLPVFGVRTEIQNDVVGPHRGCSQVTDSLSTAKIVSKNAAAIMHLAFESDNWLFSHQPDRAAD